ncbi:MAG TPA: hypothetical protein VM889_13405 [Candidatus Thermoplasmatota archaeon]|nr:hypothetical protein [Candidatus Thermoplasmatota archaeon]
MRAGRTKGQKGLRQRVYQNHWKGDQKGNLAGQLVATGAARDLGDARRWIGENCIVRTLVIEDDEKRAWHEHFMLSVLRPRFSDGRDGRFVV